MIEWQDEGFLVQASPLGERRTLATFLTRDHGRHRGVLARRPSGLLLAVRATLTWTGRLEDNLGSWQADLHLGTLWAMMQDGPVLQATSTLCALIHTLTPERVPMPLSYQAFAQTLASLCTPQGLIQYDRFEQTLLYELGYVPTLDPAGGSRHDLIRPASSERSRARPSGRPESRGGGTPSNPNVTPEKVLDRVIDRQRTFARLWPQMNDLLEARQSFVNTLVRLKAQQTLGPQRFS